MWGIFSLCSQYSREAHTNTQADAQLVQQAADFQNFADLFVDACKACQANLHVWWHSWRHRMSGHQSCLTHACHGPCSHLNWREHRWPTNHEWLCCLICSVRGHTATPGVSFSPPANRAVSWCSSYFMVWS